MFEAITALANARLSDGAPADAAALGQLAGHYAWFNHPGTFASPSCESLLHSLGLPARPPGRRTTPPRVERVLHVLTRAAAIGGHTRLVSRWMELDTGRRHSVAMTSDRPVPAFLEHSARARGGSVVSLARKGDTLIDRAERLRDLSSDFDAVLLLTHPFDVVPTIARAAGTTAPVALVNHADHVFWLGASAADLIVNLRGSAVPLNVERRALGPDRNCVVPIPLVDPRRAMSRAEAKHALGLGPQEIVMTTMASPYKFEPTAQSALLDACAEALLRVPDGVLLCVGPRDEGAWAELGARCGGRVRAVGSQPVPDVYLDAADIALDSFPFSSNTSLLELGARGTPLLCYRPPRPGAEVLSADGPGLDDAIRTETADDFVEQLVRLTRSPALRAEVGTNQRDAILSSHTGPGWLTRCDAMYERLLAVASNGERGQSWLADGRSLGEAGALDEALAELDAPVPTSLVDLALDQMRYQGTASLLGAFVSSRADVAVEPVSTTDLVLRDLQVANLRARAAVDGRQSWRGRVQRWSRAFASRGLGRLSPTLHARLRRRPNGRS